MPFPAHFAADPVSDCVHAHQMQENRHHVHIPMKNQMIRTSTPYSLCYRKTMMIGPALQIEMEKMLSAALAFP